QIASLEEDAAAFIEFAKLQGYEITIDELKAFAEDKYKALSEEELDSVAAGICGMIGCGFHEYYSAGKFQCNVIGGGSGITGANSK
ncbi:MAG: hypothetical protein J6Q81_02845, partial [Lentisphaeria bacterium]|nr:hypothetical protein [Lentisphaeria bacterium]